MNNSLAPLHLSFSAASRDGGIATAVAQLLEEQQRLGLYARWLTSDQYSPWHRDRKLLKNFASTEANLLHCHGLWRSPTRMAAKLNGNDSIPLIISPHGMLDPWAMAYSPWKKWIVWRLWEASAMQSAFCLHALCDSEAQSIRAYVKNQPIATIPNGVKLPKTECSDLPPPVWSHFIPEGDKVLVFLGRFHQKKGIEPLITAWQSVVEDAKKNGWWLVFLGFGDEGKLESQLANFPVERCLAFGPVFDDNKASALSHASAFVLPSYSEGLPMAALEAMAYQLPCLLSEACNLPDAFAVDAAIRAEPESANLITSLNSLFSLSDVERSLMGQAGFQLIVEKYNWNTVAKKFQFLYEWATGCCDRPDFVS